jgi:glycosyltransferase involved in cell wall biosynthesis
MTHARAIRYYQRWSIVPAPGRPVSSVVPTVSVIIPTYNRADLVTQAIDSVLQQTYQDFELIVVDDGSTDDTESIVRAYGDRVLYVRTQNGGTGHARNVGMEHASGRYLTFLDSDDLLYPYALEFGTRLLERFPDVSMVCAEVTGFDDHGFLERFHLKRYHGSTYRDAAITYEAIFPLSMPLPATGALPDEVLREDPGVRDRRVYYGNIYDAYLLNIVLFQNNAMLRRGAVEAIGPRNEAIYCFEELDYLVRLSRHHDVLFADVPTYLLRYHEGQLSTTVREDGRAVWLRKQRVLLHVMKRHILSDQAYYDRHRARLDRRLSDLYRSVAVPMMLVSAGPATRGRYRRGARLYLDRCRRHGHPQWALYAASFAPAIVRRRTVALIEGVRTEGVAAAFGRVATVLLRRLGMKPPRKPTPAL